ncbi:hypothetical protein KIN20_010822 [Parelaphostrongylus tenuis]|uniref:Uncharacterized protein n=1 Tax=Parelaphostrongylus tenuis TaxID=148309 RepID=A0AAD5MA62_PARTN|nr:hypothetical protein KIN20_010822 [Parelaphostrongylus tenuis]
MVAQTMDISHFPAPVMVRADICTNERTSLFSSSETSKSTLPSNSMQNFVVVCE